MLKNQIKIVFAAFSLGLFAILMLVGPLGQTAQAQILIDETNEMPASQPSARPKVGKGAAADYFKARGHRDTASAAEAKDASDRRPAANHGVDRYLTLHMGTFLSDKAYRWGNNSSDSNVGSGMFGVTYRVGEWKSSMDLLLRAEILSYKIDGERPTKLSFMPIIAFPDSRSDFPLYFGVGAGAGVFFKQVSGSSDLSLDYAVVMGSRFPNLFGDAGLFIETGIKGQFFLLSEGQQQGVYLLAGGVFVF